MINIWLGGTVCACCISMGWWCRARYKKRCDVVRDFGLLTVWLEEQIAYSMTSLPALLAQFAATHPTSALAVACRHYPAIGAVTPLAKGQWDEMRQLLLSLGHSDVAGQGKHLALCKAKAQQWKQEAADDARTKGALYAKLWAIAGVGLMIWMI